MSISARQAEILSFLEQNSPRRYTRQDILDKVWEYDSDATVGNISVQLSKLKSKCQKRGFAIPFNSTTAYSGGYWWDASCE
jgi:DNA-binding response OmpR family regulator